MIGMVLVTHGRLAAEFVLALEHVVGAQTQCIAISIGPEDDMELRRKEIMEAVGKVDIGKGVIVLTDMFGGTPSKLAISIIDARPPDGAAGRGRVEVTVAGAQEAGRKYIAVASKLLAGER